ncbi:benzoate/H(+) symporter BenE family transporter [Paenibacillus sp. GSMTC-2017]|uniref:benzoate/H(+) symporter BenE family transporter n=1 Tax=Paenibacillus sp. GSMTC-2017 TaxID=2794350 RepID=UPI0018D93F14|nr:benzoate/H(+) symporter BenE family transporter [Paenibacillus sp. GSMTC-2017]MBH5317581.1 benzoate/H(+) symporter BenE family transporter [Paenibacillus sp. GSMTC-2017]
MSIKNITAGLMSALLPCTGGAILVVQAAEMAGLSQVQLISWFAAIYIIGGALNLYLALRYKMPFAGAHSVTGVAFIGTIAANFSFAHLAGGFLMSGAIILIAGYTGLFAKALNVVPKSIIDALLAGLLLPYVLKIAPSIVNMPISGLMAVAGYFLVPKITKILPPAIWALILGLAGLFIEYDFPQMVSSAVILPIPIIPDFSLSAFFSIAIPLSLLVMSNDMAVGLAALKSNEYDPPVNQTMIASGVANMMVACFGGHAANVGGMMSAICSSKEAGPKENRYGAAIVSSVLVICFGLLAWKVIALIKLMPSHFVALITAFSLLGIFINSVKSTFTLKSWNVPAILTFVVAVMNIQWLGISAPVWALLVGVAANHIRGMKGQMKD